MIYNLFMGHSVVHIPQNMDHIFLNPFAISVSASGQSKVLGDGIRLYQQRGQV